MTDPTDSLGRILVIIPTYNEAENVRLITERVRRAVPAADILVADDNSPDGTGRIADELAASDNHIFVLHRAGKEGLGAAYVAGFGWAKDKGYDVVVEMDADGSHAPEELPTLLAALRDTDAVLGRALQMAVLEVQRSDPGILNELPRLVGEVTEEQIRAAAASLTVARRATVEVIAGGAA